jgi:hypothetical protein
VGIPEIRSPLQGPWRRWGDDIKIVLKRIEPHQIFIKSMRMRWGGHVASTDRRVAWCEYMKEEAHLKDLGVDGVIILKLF